MGGNAVGQRHQRLEPGSLGAPDAFEDVTDVFDTLLFSSGQANWYELDLEPGTYATVCFIPDPSGTPHVMLGMVEVFTVA